MEMTTGIFAPTSKRTIPTHVLYQLRETCDTIKRENLADIKFGKKWSNMAMLDLLEKLLQEYNVFGYMIMLVNIKFGAKVQNLNPQQILQLNVWQLVRHSIKMRHASYPGHNGFY